MKCVSCFNIIQSGGGNKWKNIGFELIIIEVGDGNMSVHYIFLPTYALNFQKVSGRFAVKVGKTGILNLEFRPGEYVEWQGI